MSKPFRVFQDIYIIGSSDISHPYDCCVYLIDVGELILLDSGAERSFNRLGLVIDLSHCGDQVTMDAIKYSRDPILITHSNPGPWWIILEIRLMSK